MGPIGGALLRRAVAGRAAYSARSNLRRVNAPLFPAAGQRTIMICIFLVRIIVNPHYGIHFEYAAAQLNLFVNLQSKKLIEMRMEFELREE